MEQSKNICDLVMEGGGVKGLGLVGALSVLNESGYSFCRVAGTSAGAITGALVAAGMSVEQMRKEMEELDYRKFRDEGLLDRFGLVGKGASLLFENGIYEGNYLREWLGQRLEALGVKTFGDLRLTEPWAKDLPPERRYKLVVITADITRGRLIRLPWDYRHYDLDPDTQLVADAVRASMSVPFFYEPVRMGGSLFVDGAVLSNFPINLFDGAADQPTFGIKLSAKPGAKSKMTPTKGPIEFTRAILETMMNAHDQMHLDDPCTLRRTVFVDTGAIDTLDFDITRDEQAMLYQKGRHGAEKFLASWDFAAYKAECQSPAK